MGDGRRCTLDTDGDLYPDVALDSPTCTNADEGDIDRFCVPVKLMLMINDDYCPTYSKFEIIISCYHVDFYIICLHRIIVHW